MVSVTPSLSQAADLLDWGNLAVPNATVVVESANPDAEPFIDSASTDDGGATAFATLPVGEYTIRVTRDLSPEERSQASTALGEVYALEGWATAVVDQSGGSQISIRVRGVTRGSLVLMEVFASAVPLSNGDEWTDGNYVKVFNNSDTTIALAGKLLLVGLVIRSDAPRFPCTLYRDFMADPEGIWAGFIYRFPSDAGALLPGTSVVLATDAIDHKQFGQSSGLHDLSAADFEFRGSSDVANPDAQDMLSVGPRVFPLGHGWRIWDLRSVVGIANPLDIDTLPSQLFPSADIRYVRIPSDAILDVIQWDTKYDSAYPKCPSSVFADIDAAETKIIFPWDTLAMHRRMRFVLPDGRPVLQRSKNSAADWIAAPGTPNSQP